MPLFFFSPLFLFFSPEVLAPLFTFTLKGWIKETLHVTLLSPSLPTGKLGPTHDALRTNKHSKTWEQVWVSNDV